MTDIVHNLLAEAARVRSEVGHVLPDGAELREEVAAAEIERLRAALRIIAGEEQCMDNLLGNSDVARIALYGK